MLTFPRAVYRSPGAIKAGKGLSYDAKRVEDRAAYDAAIADGWTHAPGEKPAPAPTPEPAPVADDDDAPPTRAELEDQAAKLGLKVDGRWSDKKLAERIIEAMDAATKPTTEV